MTDQEWSDATLQQERDRESRREHDREVAERWRQEMQRAHEERELRTRASDPGARGNIP
jgi:hypothetical protein